MSVTINNFTKKFIALCLTALMAAFFGVTSAFASPTTTTKDPDRNVPTVVVSSNPQETLGTIVFSTANAKNVAVGKSTVLYLSIRDMGYNFYTEFSSSDTSIATVSYVDNRAVKVVGLKNGVVTITASVEASTGIKTANYRLTIGDAVDTEQDIVSSVGNTVGIITGDDDRTDLDLFSSTTDPMLIAYAESRTDKNSTSLLLGLIGWSLIIVSGVYVLSVIIRSRTPKMSASPGSRRRYSAGSVSRSRNRLLPSKYYRNLKKY